MIPKLGSADSFPTCPVQDGPFSRGRLTRRDGQAEPNTIGSASSIPATPSPQKGKSLMPCRGGDADPNILASAYLIRDPVLRVAFLRAYRAWEKAQ